MATLSDVQMRQAVGTARVAKKLSDDAERRGIENGGFLKLTGVIAGLIRGLPDEEWSAVVGAEAIAPDDIEPTRLYRRK